MNITGSKNKCEILTNTQFYQSGTTTETINTNQSSIQITTEEGLDASNCFSIVTSIIEVDGEAECNSGVDIEVVPGGGGGAECNYINYEFPMRISKEN